MKRNLLAELKRRHVYRVAVAYAVVAWLLMQLASTVFPAFDAPAWVLRVVIAVLVIGFPVALILAWAFEVTPEGVRRTEPAESPDARAPEQHRHVGRRLDFVIIAVLVAAVGFLAWRVWSPHVAATAPAPASADSAKPATSKHETAVSPASLPAAIPAKSIAVLPFENLNVDNKDAYFVAGMQDLILTKLADIGDLKVISRTSTAKYASHPDDLKTIAEQLGVANVLEGSVQKAGNSVLINVQLIDAGSDSHIWAQAYQRTLDNVFGVEGEVAETIATALKAKLSPAETASLAAVPTQNRAAYDLFLRAEYQANKGLVNYDTASWKAAIPLYQRAVDQDPKFALAWARLSYTESELAWFGGGGLDVKQLNSQARADAERALQLQPNLSAAHLAIGYSDYWGRGDYTAALQAFAAALAFTPNDADTLAARAFVQRRQGRFEDAIASLRKALTLDPRNSALAFELGLSFMAASRFTDAEDAFQRALALDPANRNAKSYYAQSILFSTGDIARALAAAQGDDPALRLLRVALLTYQRQFPQALALLDSIPDTPDNFANNAGTKAEQMADLYYWYMGDTIHARTLYQQALPKVRAQLQVQQGINLAFVWEAIGDAELGLGHTADGLQAIAKAQAIADGSGDHNYGPAIMLTNAGNYASARRPDLAVPLLTRALASPGIGLSYSPVLLWLDPVWNPIRKDPGFQALLTKYAEDRPANIPEAAK